MMTDGDLRRAIARKRDGESLDEATYTAIVRGALAGTIDDAPLAALLMACVLRGMTLDESRALTTAFVASGETLEAPDSRTVDKHSSGGVADTASLVVVPLVAACGVPVAKLSGRALGHTGGTLDKLEAIAGVRTDLDPERFFSIVRETGCAIAAQSERLVPADKKFYALRDRTATVPSRGLIAASIVSKKIAGGAHGIVYDVKVGRGAFTATAADGLELARTLVALTHGFGRRATALVTDMDEPLGRAIGTGLEAIEARDFLRGPVRDARLLAVCDLLARAMLRIAGFEGDPAVALDRALASGAAAETFDRMLAAQGARPGALAALEPLGAGSLARAAGDGYVLALDAVALGERARDLVVAHGGGAGVVLIARTGDYVRAGEPLARLHGGDAADAAAVAAAFTIGDRPPVARPLLYGEIDVAREAGSAAEFTAPAPEGSAPRSKLESR